MEITGIRLSTRQSRGPIGTIAYFDSRITAEFRIRNMMLRRKEDGTFRVSAPHAFGSQTCTFDPGLGERLTAAAVEAYSRTFGALPGHDDATCT